MNDMKNFIYFFCLFAYIVGAIGGFGISVYNREWHIAISIVILAAMAFPTAKKMFKSLIG